MCRSPSISRDAGSYCMGGVRIFKPLRIEMDAAGQFGGEELFAPKDRLRYHLTIMTASCRKLKKRQRTARA